MIVFDLKCTHAGHIFEAWFGSSSAYEDQRARGLLICPICGGTKIEKAVMAPAVPTKGNRALVPVAKPDKPSDREMKALMSAMAKAQSKALENSTWVGKDFDAQARSMDAGETDKVSIHGEVSPTQAKALVEDGIGVLPLPFPVIPPEQQN